MFIGESSRTVSGVGERFWGPKGYPGFPMANEKGLYDRSEVFRYMHKLREDMSEWTKKNEFGLVKKVWVVKDENLGGKKAESGMLVGIGLVESGVPDFPYTPVVWMIPFENNTTLEKWGAQAEESRVELMLELIAERLVGTNPTSNVNGTKMADILRGAEKSTRCSNIENDANLVVSVHGWGGGPLYTKKHTAHLEKAVTDGGGDPQKTIMLSLGTQAAWGTSVGDASKKDLSMVPDQIQGTLEKIADQLIDGKNLSNGDSETAEIAMREAFWKRTKLVVGHSMGAWAVLRWRLKFATKLQEKRGEDDLMVALFDMVTIGSEASDDEKLKAEMFMDLKPNEKNVTLLTSFVRGWLVRHIGDILKYPSLHDLADEMRIIDLMVWTFMGEKRGFERLLHTEAILNDLPMIERNNWMLRKVGSLIQNWDEYNYALQLVDKNLIIFGMGHKDKILCPTPIRKAILRLGGKEEDILATEEHYPAHDILTRVVRYF